MEFQCLTLAWCLHIRCSKNLLPVSYEYLADFKNLDEVSEQDCKNQVGFTQNTGDYFCGDVFGHPA